jgi:glycosyltransferase involved in cell wall biosynthesis
MSDKKIKYIYWFTYYNLESPSVRYRAKYPLDFAKEQLDIPSKLVIPGYSPKRLLAFLRAYSSALLSPKKDSIIVIQRVRSRFIYFHLLKLLVKLRKERTIYDLDDADYLEHEPKTIHFFAQNCQSVAAGSREIVKYLQQFNENVLHLTSPTPDLGIVKRKRNKTFTIGWVGGFRWGHKESLYLYLFPAIKKLDFDCELHLIGINSRTDQKEVQDYFKEKRNVEVIFPDHRNWEDESGLQNKLKHFDVGIATLLDNPIQRAKSGIKAKQYMNSGVPVICNNLPENNKVVIDGYNGFVCKSAQEFSQKLSTFKKMENETYFEFSNNARQSISHFNHKKWFKDLEKIKTATLQNT